jgi:hypothetical protein
VIGKGKVVVVDFGAVWVGTAGTLNFTDPTGYAVTNFPAQVGLLPVKVMSVQTSGTASDLWWLGE